MPRRKSLLIGINYTGTKHELRGCLNDVANIRNFIIERGFPSDPASMVILTDDPRNQAGFMPTGQNMLAAFHWLVSGNNPGDSLFLHYSGHGGQVKDPDGDRESGFDDTIVPLDFETKGQLDSDTLHRVIVTPLQPNVKLTVVFDCCHSGTAIELPYVYRSDADGNVKLVDAVKQSLHLAQAAAHLIQGGFNMSKIDDARQLIAGATSFFKSLKHHGADVPTGLGKEHFVENWEEGKDVWMFSGCRDDQTSSDTILNGAATGAMSWVLIQTMRANPTQSYVQVLQTTRGLLLNKYEQIPQLSCGGQYNLDQEVTF